VPERAWGFNSPLAHHDQSAVQLSDAGPRRLGDPPGALRSGPVTPPACLAPPERV